MRRILVMACMILGLSVANLEAAVEVVSIDSAKQLVQKIRAVSPGDEVVAVDEVSVTLRDGTSIVVSAVWDGKSLVLSPKNASTVALPTGIKLFQRCSIAILIDDSDDVAVTSVLGYTNGGTSVTELTISGGQITERAEDGARAASDTYATNSDRTASDMLALLDTPSQTPNGTVDTGSTPPVVDYTQTGDQTATVVANQDSFSPVGNDSFGGGGGGSTNLSGFGGGIAPPEVSGNVSPTN